MERYSVVKRIVEDKALIEEATAFAKRLAKGPTRAHAAHKTPLRTSGPLNIGKPRPVETTAGSETSIL